MRGIQWILPALGGLLLSPLSALALNSAFYRSLDFSQPLCEQPVNLDAAREVFVEIANPVAGVEEYNDIIRAYRAHNWESYDLKREIFRKVHESSPLLEPLNFLAAQAAFERIQTTDLEGAKAAEKDLRNALVLYPKSDLAPVISATMAEFWIRAGRHTNALALYQALKNQNPGHPLSCLFSVGAGEASYLLGDRASARSAFEQGSKLCRDPRLRLAAEVRLADIAFDEEPARAAMVYDGFLKRESSRVEGLHSSILHNLGELRYREKNFKSAGYYFSRFLALRGGGDICVAQALKRTADMAFLTGETREKAAGLYLAVAETAPGTDIGLFSRLHAFLVTLPSQGESERSRRLRILDEEVDKVADRKMREVIYIEKGLAWLESGEFRAVDYLAKIPRVKEGELGRLTRIEINGLLENRVAKDGAGALDPLESAFPIWFKDSVFEDSLRKLHRDLILDSVADKIRQSDRPGALKAIDRWVRSPFYRGENVSEEGSNRLAAILLNDLFSIGVDAAERENRATQYLKQSALLAPFFKKRNSVVLAALAAAVGDVEGIKLGMDTKSSRSPASLPKNEPLRELTLLAQASAVQGLGDTKSAERLLRLVKSKEKEPIARDRLRALYAETGRPAMALDLELRNLSAAPPDGKEKIARSALKIVVEGKLWNSAGKLLNETRKLKLSDTEKAPFDFLAGRVAFEKKDCSGAVDHYEHGLKAGLTGESVAEARYRLGKCLLRMSRKSQAKKVWQDLIQMEDSFWSPLAQNELKLIK